MTQKSFWMGVLDGLSFGPVRRWVADEYREWRRRVEWPAEMQVKFLRMLISQDHRWLAHDKTARELTERYLLALNEHWYQNSYEDIRPLRDRLGLDPHKQTTDEGAKR